MKNTFPKGRTVEQCIDDLFGIVDLLSTAVDDLAAKVAAQDAEPAHLKRSANT